MKTELSKMVELTDAELDVVAAGVVVVAPIDIDVDVAVENVLNRSLNDNKVAIGVLSEINQ
jgi:hypothetical protein